MYRAILSVLLLAAMSPVAGESGDSALIPDWWSRQVVVTVPPARPEVPTIDGHVHYQEWLYASSVAGFIDAESGTLSELPVRMNVCYDESHVYIGVVLHRRPMHPTPRATFDAGRHDHIWWKDDNFELVVHPGRPDHGVRHYYAFCGNSIGAWSLMRGPIEGTGGDSSWPGDWEYAASRAGRESWHAELAIPVDHLTNAEPAAPGSVWFMDLMNQQVTPRKRMIDLGLIWNAQMHGYRSPVLPRFVFVGEDGPILRPHGVGRLAQTNRQKVQHAGLRLVFYNRGDAAYTVDGHIQIFRGPAEGGAGRTGFYDVWDRIRQMGNAEAADADAEQQTEGLETEHALLRELNERFAPLAERRGQFTVEPGGAGYFNLERPIEEGEYLVAWRFADAESGETISAQAVPYTIAPALDVSVRPFFLKYGKVRAEASLANIEGAEGGAMQFSLNADGRELDEARAIVSAGSDAVHAFLNSSGLAAGTEATVTARLVGADGEEVLANSVTVTRPPDPAWWPNDIGRSQAVPPPFEPIRADGERSFTVWQRRIEIGDNGLPRSIVSRGTELLDRAMLLDLGELRPDWSCRRVRCDDRDAVFEATGWAGDVELSMETRFHYDGTGRFELTVDPGDRPARLRRLTLDIPVAEAWARLALHHSTWTDPQRAKTEGFAGDIGEWFSRYPDGMVPFTYACYVGAEDRGVQWFCESDRGWCNVDEENVVGLAREDGAVVLRVAMIDRPLEIRRPWRVTFGLTVTPVKDASRGRDIVKAAMGKAPGIDGRSEEEVGKFHRALLDAGVNEVSIYITDPNHFGAPRIYNDEYEAAARAYAEQLHDIGLRLTPYSGWGVNANIPDFATFGQEMLAEPVKNIGWGCFLHNHASTFGDWWLWCAKHTIEQTGLDGMYMDGLAMPRLLQNELDGYSWTDRAGRQRGSYCIWAIRDFIERLYIYTHVEAPKPATIRNHYNLEQYCIGAFTDQRVTGEGQYHAGDTLLEVSSPAQARCNFMTHPNGVATTGLWWNWLKLPIKRNEMRAMYMLHDVPMVVGGGIVRYYGNQVGYGRETRPWVHVRKVRRAFEDAEFVGYWEEDVMRFEPEGPLASAWVDREGGRALVIVSNLEDRAWRGTATFDRDALGIGSTAKPYDAMFDEPMEYEGGSLDLSIEPQRYRLIVFGDRIPIPKNPRID